MRYVNSHYNIGNYFTFTIIFQCQMFTIRNTDIVNFLRNWNKPAIALLFISGHVPRHARDDGERRPFLVAYIVDCDALEAQREKNCKTAVYCEHHEAEILALKDL